MRSAVSARPLRAPFVEMKYWMTLRPSRKLLVIGVSMIAPVVLAMRPRIPASCRICFSLPRAPESTIMKTGLKRPVSRSRVCMVASMSSATRFVALDQTSMTLLYRSPSVMAPPWYSSSTRPTSDLASSTRFALFGGTTRSPRPMEVPLSVA